MPGAWRVIGILSRRQSVVYREGIPYEKDSPVAGWLLPASGFGPEEISDRHSDDS